MKSPRPQISVVIALIGVGLFFGMPLHASAPDLAVRLNTEAVQRGYTVENADATIRLGIAPNLVSEPVTVVLKQFDGTDLPTPANLRLVSGYYIYDILRDNQQKANPLILTKPFVVAVRFDSPNFFRKKIYYWANEQRGWVILPSTVDYAGHYVRAYTHLPFSRIAVFEDPSELEGVASWFRSSKATYGAATNNYPIGSRLRVRNVDDNKTVDVEVISTGPFGAGRVIDLTLPAFKMLEESWRGLVRVQVVPLNQDVKVLGVDVDKPPPISVKVAAPAAIVINEKTGAVLYEKNSQAVRPLASLTKLMTAVVFLETNTPFDQVVTYQASDNAIGSTLQVKPGETLRAKDLYYSGLVGSANNAINALVRSTGLTRAEFVSRMNAKAASWGLSHTKFTDPTGLDPTNVTTAAEYARLAAMALRDFRILQGTTTPVYSFKTINTGQPHVIKNKNKMIGTSWYITGMKTGYLDEAGYCLVVKARENKASSPDVITVLLGNATDAGRYVDTEKLLRAVFASL